MIDASSITDSQGQRDKLNVHLVLLQACGPRICYRHCQSSLRYIQLPSRKEFGVAKPSAERQRGRMGRLSNRQCQTSQRCYRCVHDVLRACNVKSLLAE
ncbi:hypothetical protein PoB_004395800 [Plakobranchus ocellatus]|uniref:Uncharacterized protein n=1 Tax=Plakobranchus ocellatus TaxID=259542 RepID=A0AAV4BD29_9GAST|nr:hypothetical protein PoB_004395800 [Plakobranchus ocellatus]